MSAVFKRRRDEFEKCDALGFTKPHALLHLSDRPAPQGNRKVLADHPPSGRSATSLTLSTPSRAVVAGIVTATLAARRLLLRLSCSHVAQQSRLLLIVEFRVEALQRGLHCRKRATRCVYRLLHGLQLGTRLGRNGLWTLRCERVCRPL